MRSKRTRSWESMDRLASEMNIMRDHVCNLIKTNNVRVNDLYPCVSLSRASFYYKLKYKKFTAGEMVSILNEILKSNINSTN